MYKLTRVQFDILENLVINVSDKKIIEDILLKKYPEEVIKRDGDGTHFLRIVAWFGVVVSILFMVLQIIPLPFLHGVHFGKESYMLLFVWVIIGWLFYMKNIKNWVL